MIPHMYPPVGASSFELAIVYIVLFIALFVGTAFLGIVLNVLAKGCHK